MTKLCSFTLSTDTIYRLEKLIEMTGPTNKSRVLRELVDKEYTFRMGLLNAVA